MGATVSESLTTARSLFDRASGILGYDLLELCKNGPAEKLNSTVHSQPALFVSSLAALEQLKESAPELVSTCSATAGLSLGEYTALVFAEAIDFDAGVRLVQQRGQAMQDASDMRSSGMVSLLGLDRDKIESLCDEAREDGVLQIANFLCPGNIVVSGSQDACERVAPLAEAAGAMNVIPLTVAGAFHTSIMQPAIEKLATALTNIEIRTPKIPVVSNVDARPHDNPDEIRSLLVDQVIKPVQWENSMRLLIDEMGIGHCYEIGPGRVLRGLLKRIARKLPCENVAA